jgi:hypothetical protein
MRRSHRTDARHALLANLLGLGTGAAMVIGLTPVALALLRALN